MKKDRLKVLEDKYWKGKSSLEDDQELKDHGSDVYFQRLREAKKEQMEWDFDDFLAQTTENPIAEPSPMRRSFIKPLWKYMGMVAALILVGFIFFKTLQKNDTTGSESTYVSHDVVQDVEEQKSNMTIKREIEPLLSVKKNVHKPPRIAKRQTSPLGEAEKVTDPNTEAYVLVNGEPIYDEQKATEIALSSLRLMASNFKEGRQAVEKIKYIKVEL